MKTYISKPLFHFLILWVRRFCVGVMVGLLVVSSIFSMLTGQVSAAPAKQVTLPMTVIINEVAWAGTQANTSDEWIELYNPGAAPVSLAGWVIRTTESPTPAINNQPLSGTIPAGGYFLLERTDDSSVNDIAGDVFYTGGLANGGATLELLDNTSTLIDTANANGSGAWPAGNASPSYCSMERVPGQQDADTAWVTNDGSLVNGHDAGGNPICGTPKSLNSAITLLTPTQTSTATSTLTITATGPIPTFTTTPTPTHTPTFTRTPDIQKIIINEVAWSGTGASPSDEWIELYNPGPFQVNLTDWVINITTSGDPTITIPLNSVILSPGDYYLLENDENSTNIASDQTSPSMDLSNSGSMVLLHDALGRQVDTANFNQGAWPAGSSSPRCSMERASEDAADQDGGWFTNDNVTRNGLDANGDPICGTPKDLNWAYTVTATPTFTPTRTHTPTRTRTPTPGIITLTLTSIAAQDGWILESSENSNLGGSINSTSSLLTLGDNASNKQYRSMLSFKTSSIPDNAIITSVKLKLTKQNVTGGGNPMSIFQGFMIDLKTGFFDTSAALQATDFQATTSQTLGPASSVLSGNTYTITLTAGASKINKLSTNAGLTQIRLRFKLDDNNNSLANYLGLFSGNAPAADRPQLVITYTVP